MTLNKKQSSCNFFCFFYAIVKNFQAFNKPEEHEPNFSPHGSTSRRSKKSPSLFERPAPHNPPITAANPNKNNLNTDENLITEHENANFSFEEKPPEIVVSSFSKKEQKIKLARVFPIDEPQRHTQKKGHVVIASVQSNPSSSGIGGMMILRKNMHQSVSFGVFECCNCLMNSSCLFFHSNSSIRNKIGLLIKSRLWKYLISCNNS